MFKIKKLLICSVVLINISSNVYAKTIPGVTRPYDPPNYYSPENISIPDSAPSPFTLIDLAKNGYLVHDVKDTKKDIISNIKTYTEYLNLAKNYLLALSDLFHSEDNYQVNAILNNQEQDISNLSSFSSEADLNNIDKHLYNITTSKNKTDLNYNDKYSYLNNIYISAYKLSKNEYYTFDEKKQYLNYTIDKLKNISSTMQGKEALATMNLLKELELLKQQQLINQITTVNVAKIKDNEDDKFRYERENLQFFNLNFEDPYNPSKYYKEHYTKSSGKGFANFE